MQTTADELRALARQIEEIGRASPVWSIVNVWVMTLADHLQAVAAVHERERDGQTTTT